MEVPEIRGTILGVPIMSIIVFWGAYWGPLIQGNYHIGDYIGNCYRAYYLHNLRMPQPQIGQLRRRQASSEPWAKVLGVKDLLGGSGGLSK